MGLGTARTTGGSGFLRSLLRLVPLLVGMGVLLWLCRTFGLQGLEHAFKQLEPLPLAVYALLAVSVLLGYSARWAMVSRAVGVQVPLPRFVAARLAGDALGFLLPGGRIGGDPYRVALLYSRGSPGVSATAGVAADRMLEMTGNTLAAMTYITIYSTARAEHVSLALLTTLLILLAATIGTVAALWFEMRPFSPVLQSLLPAATWRRGILDTMRRIEDELARFFRQHPSTFVLGLLASLLIEVMIVVEYYFLFSAFGLPLDLPTILMVLLGGGAARAIPAPASLGTLEASQVTVLALTSGRPELGFVVGLILRLHETVWLLLGLGVVAIHGLTPKRVHAPATEPGTT